MAVALEGQIFMATSSNYSFRGPMCRDFRVLVLGLSNGVIFLFSTEVEFQLFSTMKIMDANGLGASAMPCGGQQPPPNTNKTNSPPLTNACK